MKRAAAAPLGSSRARASATLESRTQPRSTRFDLTSALPNEVGGVARGDRRQRLPNDPESLEYFHFIVLAPDREPPLRTPADRSPQQTANGGRSLRVLGASGTARLERCERAVWPRLIASLRRDHTRVGCCLLYTSPSPRD